MSDIAKPEVKTKDIVINPSQIAKFARARLGAISRYLEQAHKAVPDNKMKEFEAECWQKIGELKQEKLDDETQQWRERLSKAGLEI